MANILREIDRKKGEIQLHSIQPAIYPISINILPSTHSQVNKKCLLFCLTFQCINFSIFVSFLRNFEDRVALDGGFDGLNLIEDILDNAHNVLEPKGFIALEVDVTHNQILKEMFDKDYNGKSSEAEMS